jgi:DNA-binding XRE family transcriptional regulator
MLGDEGLSLRVYPGKGEDFEVGSDDPKPLVRLLLQRKRELSGLSLAQAAERLGASSRNAYARYEKGRSVPSVAKFLELLRAVSPGSDIVLQDSRRTPPKA